MQRRRRADGDVNASNDASAVSICAVIDPHERDTRYIYDEIFVSQIYYHPEMRIPKHPVIMDVGANIGLYCRLGAPPLPARDIYCYEASPRTFPYLSANATSLVDPEITRAHLFNRALARRSGQQLTLYQSPLVSGISTLLDRDKVRWVQELTASGEIMTHEVVTSTVSAEIAANKIAEPRPAQDRRRGLLHGSADGHRPSRISRGSAISSSRSTTRTRCRRDARTTSRRCSPQEATGPIATRTCSTPGGAEVRSARMPSDAWASASVASTSQPT